MVRIPDKKFYMKRVLLSILIFITLSTITVAQSFNNAWIDYSKTYFKFKVSTTGLYRISQSSLSSLGIGSTSADQFQLWRNGKQVPIYTTISTGVMGVNDYIEFWGEMNDGIPDNELFVIPDYQLNKKWSLQTDTAAFFLTVNTTVTQNLRLRPATNNIAGNTLLPDTYFTHVLGNYFRERINSGYASVVGEYVYSSAYDKGEGFASNDLGGGQTRSIVHNNLFVNSSGPAPRFRINSSGNANNTRFLSVVINGDTVANNPLDYFDYTKVDNTIALSTIISSNVLVNIINRTAEPNDRIAVAQYELEYSRQFNFGGERNFFFKLPANIAGNYLEITGLKYGIAKPVLYDISNGKRYVADTSNLGLIKVKLDPSAVERNLVLVGQEVSNINSVNSFTRRNFINYTTVANQGDYLIISHPNLFAGANGTNPVEEYRAYRSSVTGGSHIAKTYLIDELVDQFAFGIKKHPSAIRNFILYANTNFLKPVKNVFLIGKGVTYVNYRYNESNPNVEILGMVPTFGSPASDNLFTSVPGTSMPLIPIGRLSVINASEVAIYLKKVKDFEAVQASPSPLIQDKAWMKNIVHIVGASDLTLGTILYNYMQNYKIIAIDTFYGAKVHLFAKGTPNSVDLLKSTELNNLFAEGINLMTYFGHSSATTFEYNIDNPVNYNNPGKYPFFIALGCNAGNFYNFNLARLQVKETLSEQWVLAQDRGSIAFLASTHFGIVHYLNLINTNAYKAFANSQYGKSFGEIMKETIVQVFNIASQADYFARFHVEQLAIHGDPALVVNPQKKPDYVIEDQLVKVSPNFVSIADANFKVDAKFMNIGKAINKKIVVEVKRQYPDASIAILFSDTIPGIRYIDSLSYTIAVDRNRDKGTNKITITVDANNAVDELFETNNSITKTIIIYEDEARPVYPSNFAIINKQGIKLTASTANPFSTIKQYRMEMDTTELFNSPSKITQTINSVGGLLEFNPGISFVDNRVYYWRVAFIPATGLPAWNSSSFIFISNSDLGYNQSHYFQHIKSETENISINPINKSWEFADKKTNIFIQNGVFPTACSQAGCLSVGVNGDPFIRSVCGVSGIIFNVFNPLTMKPWQNSESGVGLYGSDPVCGSSRIYNFQFNILDSNKRRKVVEFLDLIPDGYYVIVRNISGTSVSSNTYASTWRGDTSYLGKNNSIYLRLVEQGFTSIDSFDRPRAFSFAYKKNRLSIFSPKAAFSDGINDLMTLNIDFISPDSIGFISSPVFGPAKSWKDLKWRGNTVDSKAGDAPTISIIGIQPNGTESTLFSGINLNQQDFSIASINANVYPYLKLRMRNIDSVNYTPYQLNYWRLTYVPIPEGAIAPNLFIQMKDSLEVGEPFNFKVAFKNVSDASFDSLKVKLIVTDKNNVQNIIPLPRHKPLIASDTVHIRSNINTTSLIGTNSLYFEVNPDFDQPELYQFNNFGFRQFYVRADSVNPVMDITFDGVHILNRDLVSSKPNILIKLKDEAKWNILKDTSLFKVKIRFPNGVLKSFNFNNDTLKFTPAGQAPNPDNTAIAEFNPFFQQDGEYELIVTGKDANNNQAGNTEYKVVFQVINKPMISNMLNYPNPFTSSTAFVFTVTGSQVPQNIKIEIMTVTGKIVREITKQELGPLHIGRNITEYKWDGTDQFGQKLANGIYLYRVVTNLNGKIMEKYKATDDKTDQYFNKGYGKMYLMR